MRGISREDRTRACLRCGRGFITRVNSRGFCTSFCGEQAARDRKRTKRREAIQALLGECPGCGKRFPQDTVRARLYCSTACIKRAWKVSHRDRHLDATLSDRHKKKYAGNYLAALRRDDAMCMRCGAPGAHVHHIDNRGDKCTIMPRNHTLDNLTSVCQKCHVALHKLDWAIDDREIVISCEAFKPLLGTSVIRVTRKDVMPHDA